MRTTGGGLANRLTTALSRVAWNFKSINFNYFLADHDEEEKKLSPDHDEDLSELQTLIEEFNAIADLTVKYNS